MVTANLFFSQVPYQTQPPDIERGMMGEAVKNPLAVPKTYDESSEDSFESFLDTLGQIAKDEDPNKPTPEDGEGKLSTSSVCNPEDQFDPTALEAGISETTKQQEEDRDNLESQIPPPLNLAAVNSLLEKLGLYDSAGGSSSANKVGGVSGNAEGLTALNMLIARLGQNDVVLSTEMKTELERLQKFIANAQSGTTSSHNDGIPLGEVSDSQSTDPTNLNQLLNGIASGQEDQRDNSGVHLDKSGSGEKASAYFAKLDGIAAKLSTDIKQTESFQSAENLTTASSSEHREKADSTKLVAEARIVGVETGVNTKESKSLETIGKDAPGFENSSDTPGKTGAPGPVNRISSTIDPGKHFGGESLPQNLPNNESSSVIKIVNDVQSEKALRQGQRYTGETVHDNSSNNESSPVSKMIHDAQEVKENNLKMDTAMSDESGGKVTKMDAGASHSGLMSSQNQTAEKAFEATSTFKPTEPGPDSLRTQTVDQIVRKAVIYMRNGQHEAKIDLKPEFLGHVRMQVTTENHQVTVKILTEFGFVKDMVENTIHQLKADLQQQGLNVDKLEVAVSNDSDEYKHPQEKTDQAKDRQSSLTRINPGNREGEIRKQAGNFGLRRAGETTVDYFA